VPPLVPTVSNNPHPSMSNFTMHWAAPTTSAPPPPIFMLPPMNDGQTQPSTTEPPRYLDDCPPSPSPSPSNSPDSSELGIYPSLDNNDSYNVSAVAKEMQWQDMLPFWNGMDGTHPPQGMDPSRPTYPSTYSVESMQPTPQVLDGMYPLAQGMQLGLMQGTKPSMQGMQSPMQYLMQGMQFPMQGMQFPMPGIYPPTQGMYPSPQGMYQSPQVSHLSLRAMLPNMPTGMPNMHPAVQSGIQDPIMGSNEVMARMASQFDWSNVIPDHADSLHAPHNMPFVSPAPSLASMAGSPLLIAPPPPIAPTSSQNITPVSVVHTAASPTSSPVLDLAASNGASAATSLTAALVPAAASLPLVLPIVPPLSISTGSTKGPNSKVEKAINHLLSYEHIPESKLDNWRALVIQVSQNEAERGHPAFRVRIMV
jgi:hypothetical protein